MQSVLLANALIAVLQVFPETLVYRVPKVALVYLETEVVLERPDHVENQDQLDLSDHLDPKVLE